MFAMAAGLYSVSVVVPPDQTADSRAVQTQAVTRVLERLTGAPVANASKLAPMLASPDQWIASWGYETDLDEVSRTVTYQVDREIRDELARSGVPVWTQPRPAQWLWLIVNEGQGRQSLSDDSQSEFLRALQAESDRWQVPFALPAWDQTDLNWVNPAELWGLFVDGVERAAQRYSGEYTAGRVIQLNGQWQISVKTHDNRRFNQSFNSAAELAAGLYRFWLPPLVAEYAITGQGQTDLAVYNLDPDAYQTLIQFLRSQDAIERAWPIYSDRGVSVIRLLTGARPDQIQSLLAQLPNIESAEAADLMLPVQVSVNWIQ